MAQVPRLPPLNEKLIACVLQHIEAHPEEFFQNDWIRLVGSLEDEWCGTLGCFAGWATLLTTPINQWSRIGVNNSSWGCTAYATARDRLGLTDAEAHLLFEGVDNACVSLADKQSNIKTIKQRLRDIRIRRGLPPEGVTSNEPNAKG
jgi:hypothetical protein